jgi:hypothetical protein
LPPDILAGLAALAPDGKDAAPAAGDPQGDDVETPKKRKPRKAKKN